MAPPTLLVGSATATVDSQTTTEAEFRHAR